jgi:hypothetical protein
VGTWSIGWGTALDPDKVDGVPLILILILLQSLHNELAFHHHQKDMEICTLHHRRALKACVGCQIIIIPKRTYHFGNDSSAKARPRKEIDVSESTDLRTTGGYPPSPVFER